MSVRCALQGWLGLTELLSQGVGLFIDYASFRAFWVNLSPLRRGGEIIPHHGRGVAIAAVVAPKGGWPCMSSARVRMQRSGGSVKLLINTRALLIVKEGARGKVETRDTGRPHHPPAKTIQPGMNRSGK